MARPWLRWLRGITIALAVVVATLALPWVVSNCERGLMAAYRRAHKIWEPSLS